MDFYLQKYLFDKYYHMFDKPHKKSKVIMPIQFGFECGNGWFNLFDNLLYNINTYQRYNLEKDQYVTITQVKEKYGSLNVYFSGGDDIISGMVWFAEHLSMSICEKCGSTEKIGMTKGWVRVLCEKCASSYHHQWSIDKKEERKIKLYKIIYQ